MHQNYMEIKHIWTLKYTEISWHSVASELQQLSPHHCI